MYCTGFFNGYESKKPQNPSKFGYYVDSDNDDMITPDTSTSMSNENRHHWQQPRFEFAARRVPATQKLDIPLQMLYCDSQLGVDSVETI